MVFVVFQNCLDHKIQDDCPKLDNLDLQNSRWPPTPYWKPKKKVLSLEPNVPKKQIKQLFILSLRPRSNGKILTVFWDHLTYKSEMATQFVCLFISPLTWDTQSETIQEASVLSWGPVASDAIFRYITVISLEPDVSLRPRKCHFLLILALQIC